MTVRQSVKRTNRLCLGKHLEGGRGVKSLMHACVLHEKKGGGGG